MAERIRVQAHEDGALLDVWVVPGAKRSEIVGPHDGALRVRVAAPAESGKANEAVAGLLAREFGARSAYLAGGIRSRRKRFVIVGLSPGEVSRSIAART